MTSDARLASVLERRRRALVQSLEGAQVGETEAIHQLRVATRRLREVLPLLVGGPHPRRVKKLARRVRALTRSLGPVRELDVAAASLATHAARLETPVQIEALTESLARRRARAFVVFENVVGDPTRVAKLVNRLAELSGTPASDGDPSQWRRELARRVDTRAKGLRSAIETAGALYVADRLHALRLATKKLRYALELADECRIGRVRSMVRTLKTNQDLLGRLHDFDVLVGLVRRHRATEGQVREALITTLDHQCRVLHAEFLRDRERLIAVADAAADHLVEAVSAADTERVAPRRRVAVPRVKTRRRMVR